MVEPSSVPKVGSVDGELVVSVQLRLNCVVARPWITTAALQHEHAMVDSRAIERTECINFRRRCVYHVDQAVIVSKGIWTRTIVGITSEDDVPFIIYFVKLRCP